MAVNLDDDADSAGAIYGQLAPVKSMGYEIRLVAHFFCLAYRSSIGPVRARFSRFHWL